MFSGLVKKVFFASGAWSPSEDAKLLRQYKRLGPAWDLIQKGLTGRRPAEVRYRFLVLSGLLTHYGLDYDGSKPPSSKDLDDTAIAKNLTAYAQFISKTTTPKLTQRQAMLTEGWEPHGSRTWLRFPIEQDGLSAFQHLAKACPQYTRRRLKRKAGWTEIERMAAQQGFDEHGSNWQLIARGLHRRTPAEVKGMLEYRYAALNNNANNNINVKSENTLSKDGCGRDTAAVEDPLPQLQNNLLSQDCADPDAIFHEEPLKTFTIQ